VIQIEHFKFLRQVFCITSNFEVAVLFGESPLFVSLTVRTYYKYKHAPHLIATRCLIIDDNNTGCVFGEASSTSRTFFCQVSTSMDSGMSSSYYAGCHRNTHQLTLTWHGMKNVSFSHYSMFLPPARLINLPLYGPLMTSFAPRLSRLSCNLAKEASKRLCQDLLL